MKLLDFGVAKVLDSMTPAAGAQPTVTLMRALTINFASPEQIRGESVTTVSDVYSLGVLLYHLLTGVSPYRSASGPSVSAVSREICEQLPVLPSNAGPARVPASADRQRCAELRGDLDSIVMLTLQKDPARRYSSVDLLAADIRRYLDNRPVLARGNTVSDRVSKFVRRHRLATAASAAALSPSRGRDTARAQRARPERRSRAAASGRAPHRTRVAQGARGAWRGGDRRGQGAGRREDPGAPRGAGRAVALR